ncbi:MAG: NADH:flavin oxidoreductase [Halopseudomonas aestusnigri]
MNSSKLFEPRSLGGISVPNRLVVAPLTRTSAQADGIVGPLMTDYYTNFAKGGFGAIITEGTYTDQAYSQGYANQPGITNCAQQESWRPVVDAVKSNGAKFIMQLMHAGALSQFNAYNTETRAPSSVLPKGEQMSVYKGQGSYKTPREISRPEIEQVIEGFVLSAGRAKQVGFDGVEIHGANGYLLDQFLTGYTNNRMDAYGGSVASRVRLATEIAIAVRQEVGPDFVVGIRISQGKVNDFNHKWAGGLSDAETIFGALSGIGLDYIHTTEFEADQPAFGDGETLSALAKRISGLPVIANGSLHEPHRASALLENGGADFVSLGRGAIANSNWPNLTLENLSPRDFDPEILTPFADLNNAEMFEEKMRA